MWGDYVICPEELVAIIATIAVGIAKDLTIDQISILSSAFVLLGDNLAVIAIQRENIENCCNMKRSKEEINVI